VGISKRASVSLNGGKEGVETVEGDGEEKRGIGDEEYECSNAENENGEACDATVHGIVGKMKDNKETRKEQSHHEQCVEWSDKKFHETSISRKKECGKNSSMVKAIASPQKIQHSSLFFLHKEKNRKKVMLRCKHYPPKSRIDYIRSRISIPNNSRATFKTDAVLLVKARRAFERLGFPSSATGYLLYH